MSGQARSKLPSQFVSRAGELGPPPCGPDGGGQQVPKGAKEVLVGRVDSCDQLKVTRPRDVTLRQRLLGRETNVKIYRGLFIKFDTQAMQEEGKSNVWRRGGHGVTM